MQDFVEPLQSGQLVSIQILGGDGIAQLGRGRLQRECTGVSAYPNQTLSARTHTLEAVGKPPPPRTLQAVEEKQAFAHTAQFTAEHKAGGGHPRMLRKLVEGELGREKVPGKGLSRRGSRFKEGAEKGKEPSGPLARPRLTSL